jgi:hypothetical protein
LADNGLDEKAAVRIGTIPGGYYVEDHGGIDPEKRQDRSMELLATRFFAFGA